MIDEHNALYVYAKKTNRIFKGTKSIAVHHNVVTSHRREVYSLAS